VTVAEALNAIRRVGTVENQAGNLRLRFPETAASELRPAVDALRTGKAEALTLMASRDPAQLARASAVFDRTGVPVGHKARRADEEFVKLTYSVTMEPHPAEPRKARDRMLNEMGWCSTGIPWADWKAAAMNRLFQQHGATRKPGRITAATVRHGERKAGSNG
jgi:hypothetical protein